MDITTLAAWGEFLGGIAVVVSLIYLASQIRQNSKLLRTSTASATNDSVSSIFTLMVPDPEVARIFWWGSANRDALASTDRQRFDPLIGLMMSGEHGEWGPDARARHERELAEARESGDPERVREVEEREPICGWDAEAQIEICGRRRPAYPDREPLSGDRR